MTDNPAPRRTLAPLIGAVVFLGLYLAVGSVSDAFARQSLPMPDAPVSEVYSYFTGSGAASIATGVLHLLSAAGLAVFVAAVTRSAPAGRSRDALRLSGWAGVATIGVSALVAIFLGLAASSLSPETVIVWRDISFYSGGVAHVVSLGAAALTIALWTRWSRPVRVMSWIAGVPAILSVASLIWYYASILLPGGRLLSMVAFIVAAVSLLRGRSLAASDLAPTPTRRHRSTGCAGTRPAAGSPARYSPRR